MGLVNNIWDTVVKVTQPVWKPVIQTVTPIARPVIQTITRPPIQTIQTITRPVWQPVIRTMSRPIQIPRPTFLPPRIQAPVVRLPTIQQTFNRGSQLFQRSPLAAVNTMGQYAGNVLRAQRLPTIRQGLNAGAGVLRQTPLRSVVNAGQQFQRQGGVQTLFNQGSRALQRSPLAAVNTLGQYAGNALRSGRLPTVQQGLNAGATVLRQTPLAGAVNLGAQARQNIVRAGGVQGVVNRGSQLFQRSPLAAVNTMGQYAGSALRSGRLPTVQQGLNAGATLSRQMGLGAAVDAGQSARQAIGRSGGGVQGLFNAGSHLLQRTPLAAVNTFGQYTGNALRSGRLPTVQQGLNAGATLSRQMGLGAAVDAGQAVRRSGLGGLNPIPAASAAGFYQLSSGRADPVTDLTRNPRRGADPALANVDRGTDFFGGVADAIRRDPVGTVVKAGLLVNPVTAIPTLAVSGVNRFLTSRPTGTAAAPKDGKRFDPLAAQETDMSSAEIRARTRAQAQADYDAAGGFVGYLGKTAGEAVAAVNPLGGKWRAPDLSKAGSRWLGDNRSAAQKGRDAARDRLVAAGAPAGVVDENRQLEAVAKQSKANADQYARELASAGYIQNGQFQINKDDPNAAGYYAQYQGLIAQANADADALNASSSTIKGYNADTKAAQEAYEQAEAGAGSDDRHHGWFFEMIPMTRRERIIAREAEDAVKAVTPEWRLTPEQRSGGWGTVPVRFAHGMYSEARERPAEIFSNVVGTGLTMGLGGVPTAVARGIGGPIAARVLPAAASTGRVAQAARFIGSKAGTIGKVGLGLGMGYGIGSKIWTGEDQSAGGYAERVGRVMTSDGVPILGAVGYAKFAPRALRAAGPFTAARPGTIAARQAEEAVAKAAAKAAATAGKPSMLDRFIGRTPKPAAQTPAGAAIRRDLAGAAAPDAAGVPGTLPALRPGAAAPPAAAPRYTLPTGERPAFGRVPMTTVGADGRRIVPISDTQIRAAGEFNLASRRAVLSQSNPAALAQEEQAFLQTLGKTNTISIPHTPTGRYVSDEALHQLSKSVALAREAGYEVEGAIVLRNNALEVGVRQPAGVPARPVAEPVAAPVEARPAPRPAAEVPAPASAGGARAGRSRAMFDVFAGSGARVRTPAPETVGRKGRSPRASETGDVLVRTPRQSARVGTRAADASSLEQQYARAFDDYANVGNVATNARAYVRKRVLEPDRFKVTNARQNAVLNEFFREEGIRPEALSADDVAGVTTRFGAWARAREASLLEQMRGADRDLYALRGGRGEIAPDLVALEPDGTLPVTDDLVRAGRHELEMRRVVNKGDAFHADTAAADGQVSSLLGDFYESPATVAHAGVPEPGHAANAITGAQYRNIARRVAQAMESGLEVTGPVRVRLAEDGYTFGVRPGTGTPAAPKAGPDFIGTTPRTRGAGARARAVFGDNLFGARAKPAAAAAADAAPVPAAADAPKAAKPKPDFVGKPPKPKETPEQRIARQSRTLDGYDEAIAAEMDRVDAQYGGAREHVAAREVYENRHDLLGTARGVEVPVGPETTPVAVWRQQWLDRRAALAEIRARVQRGERVDGQEIARLDPANLRVRADAGNVADNALLRHPDLARPGPQFMPPAARKPGAIGAGTASKGQIRSYIASLEARLVKLDSTKALLTKAIKKGTTYVRDPVTKQSYRVDDPTAWQPVVDRLDAEVAATVTEITAMTELRGPAGAKGARGVSAEQWTAARAARQSAQEGLAVDPAAVAAERDAEYAINQNLRNEVARLRSARQQTAQQANPAVARIDREIADARRARVRVVREGTAAIDAEVARIDRAHRALMTKREQADLAGRPSVVARLDKEIAEQARLWREARARTPASEVARLDTEIERLTAERYEASMTVDDARLREIEAAIRTQNRAHDAARRRGDTAGVARIEGEIRNLSLQRQREAATLEAARTDPLYGRIERLQNEIGVSDARLQQLDGLAATAKKGGVISPYEMVEPRAGSGSAARRADAFLKRVLGDDAAGRLREMPPERQSYGSGRVARQDRAVQDALRAERETLANLGGRRADLEALRAEVVATGTVPAAVPTQARVRGTIGGKTWGGRSGMRDVDVAQTKMTPQEFVAEIDRDLAAVNAEIARSEARVGEYSGFARERAALTEAERAAGGQLARAEAQLRSLDARRGTLEVDLAQARREGLADEVARIEGEIASIGAERAALGQGGLVTDIASWERPLRLRENQLRSEAARLQRHRAGASATNRARIDARLAELEGELRQVRDARAGPDAYRGAEPGRDRAQVWGEREAAYAAEVDRVRGSRSGRPTPSKPGTPTPHQKVMQKGDAGTLKAADEPAWDAYHDTYEVEDVFYKFDANTNQIIATRHRYVATLKDGKLVADPALTGTADLGSYTMDAPAFRRAMGLSRDTPVTDVEFGFRDAVRRRERLVATERGGAPSSAGGERVFNQDGTFAANPKDVWTKDGKPVPRETGRTKAEAIRKRRHEQALKEYGGAEAAPTGESYLVRAQQPIPYRSPEQVRADRIASTTFGKGSEMEALFADANRVPVTQDGVRGSAPLADDVTEQVIRSIQSGERLERQQLTGRGPAFESDVVRTTGFESRVAVERDRGRLGRVTQEETVFDAPEGAAGATGPTSRRTEAVENVEAAFEEQLFGTRGTGGGGGTGGSGDTGGTGGGRAPKTGKGRRDLWKSRDADEAGATDPGAGAGADAPGSRQQQKQKAKPKQETKKRDAVDFLASISEKAEAIMARQGAAVAKSEQKTVTTARSAQAAPSAPGLDEASRAALDTLTARTVETRANAAARNERLAKLIGTPAKPAEKRVRPPGSNRGYKPLWAQKTSLSREEAGKARAKEIDAARAKEAEDRVKEGKPAAVERDVAIPTASLANQGQVTRGAGAYGSQGIYVSTNAMGVPTLRVGRRATSASATDYEEEDLLQGPFTIRKFGRKVSPVDDLIGENARTKYGETGFISPSGRRAGSRSGSRTGSESDRRVGQMPWSRIAPAVTPFTALAPASIIDQARDQSMTPVTVVAPASALTPRSEIATIVTPAVGQGSAQASSQIITPAQIINPIQDQTSTQLQGQGSGQPGPTGWQEQTPITDTPVTPIETPVPPVVPPIGGGLGFPIPEGGGGGGGGGAGGGYYSFEEMAAIKTPAQIVSDLIGYRTRKYKAEEADGPLSYEDLEAAEQEARKAKGKRRAATMATFLGGAAPAAEEAAPPLAKRQTTKRTTMLPQATKTPALFAVRRTGATKTPAMFQIGGTKKKAQPLAKVQTLGDDGQYRYVQTPYGVVPLPLRANPADRAAVRSARRINDFIGGPGERTSKHRFGEFGDTGREYAVTSKDRHYQEDPEMSARASAVHDLVGRDSDGVDRDRYFGFNRNATQVGRLDRLMGVSTRRTTTDTFGEFGDTGREYTVVSNDPLANPLAKAQTRAARRIPAMFQIGGGRGRATPPAFAVGRGTGRARVGADAFLGGGNRRAGGLALPAPVRARQSADAMRDRFMGSGAKTGRARAAAAQIAAGWPPVTRSTDGRRTASAMTDRFMGASVPTGKPSKAIPAALAPATAPGRSKSRAATMAARFLGR